MTNNLPDPRISDPVLGNITVYREFKPNRDSIEYTVYFWRDGIKFRTDLEIETSEFFDVKDEDAENFVAQRLYKQIEEGDYAPAHGYVQYMLDREAGL